MITTNFDDVVDKAWRAARARSARSKPQEDDQRPLHNSAALDGLPDDHLLTADEVLSVLPVPMDRRAWLRGVRQGRFPAVSVRWSRKGMRWRVDVIRALVRTMMDQGEAG